MVQRISEINGEPIGMVYHILQGKSGFIWLGTNQGLIRFDGYNLKRFEHDEKDPSTLSNNLITGMIEDKQGYLWITTYGGGLNRFDLNTYQFIHFKHQADDLTTIGSNNLYDVVKSYDNKLWLASDSGVILFDPISAQVVSKNTAPTTRDSWDQKRVMTVFEDSQKQLWYSVAGQGLFRFVRDLQIVTVFEHDKVNPDSLDSNTVNKIFEDSRGDIWVGTSKGMNRFDPNTEKFHHFSLTLKVRNKIKALNIRTIFEDSKQRLWVGTIYNGLSLFDPGSQSFIEINDDSNRQDAITSIGIAAMMEDSSGTLWLGSPDQGLIKITEQAFWFEGLTADSKHSLRLGAIFIDSKGIIWLGANESLYQYDKDTGKYILKAETKGFIHAITEAENNTLTLSVYREGLFTFDPQNQKLSPFQIENSSLPHNKIRTVTYDSEGTLWISLDSSSKNSASGLFSLDREHHSFRQHFSGDSPISILPLSKDRLLVGFLRQGLKIYHIPSEKWTDIQYQNKSIGTTWALYQDEQKRIWVGTQKLGLGLFNAKTLELTFISQRDGLPANDVTTLIADEQGIIWMGTGKGLASFDPQSKAINQFGHKEGLRINYFVTIPIIKTSDGDIIIIDNEQLIRFSPADLQPSPTVNITYPTVLTELNVLNKIVEPDVGNVEAVLNRVVNETEHITLSYEDYLFSISFTSANYNNQDKLRYAYKLEGLDELWIETNSRERIATFTSLSPQDYELKIKVSNTDGSWNDHYRSIKITITPPPWQTWPAFILYTLLILSSIYLIYRIRANSLIKKARALELGIIERTSTINTLLAQKQQLFANVSHEFRTPLTLILTPVESLLSDPKGQQITTELKLIQRSGLRLLRLVDQLLEFAKLEQRGEVSKQAVSIKQTINNMVASFQPLADSKQVSLDYLPFEDITLLLIQDSLNTILSNILSNAIKYSNSGGNILITVIVHDAKIDISIKDDGIGINKDNQKIVFERFTRVNQEHSESVPGTGIGLALVKELVEANMGKINLISQINQGAEFIITLPLIIIETAGVSIPAETKQQDIAQLNLELNRLETPAPKVFEDGDLIQNSKLKSVLIIDDNGDMRDLLYGLLKDNYQCLLAENGERGLAVARKVLPDLVISDIMMPVMDGYQLTQLLKEDELTSHIPIILLTAKGGLESRIQGLQLMVDDYLAKPFHREELQLRIHNILTLRDIVRKRFGKAIDHNEPQKQVEKFKFNLVDQQFYQKVDQQLERLYTETDFTAKVLSDALGMSEKQLQRKLKALFDLTFPELVRNYRLNKATQLLLNGERASQIYHVIGFASHSYFASCFKAKFGQTPKAYQQVQPSLEPISNF